MLIYRKSYIFDSFFKNKIKITSYLAKEVFPHPGNPTIIMSLGTSVNYPFKNYKIYYFKENILFEIQLSKN